jgi:ParB family transcriptional regulator, chromosome partitioning protein
MPLNLSMLDEPAPSNELLSGTPLMLPAAALIEDKNNPRTTFDTDKLAELAADIQTRGILQPIIVRPAVEGVHTIMFGAR